MRIVWVLTALHFVAGGGGPHVHALAARDPQLEQITIGIYASRSACERMRAQLSHAPEFKVGSARCIKEAN